eukprot:m.31686 g.31686  ORF g.31686 m.31686 type:complete len:197 (-) comp9720_c0_seq1:182-772(-)
MMSETKSTSAAVETEGDSTTNTKNPISGLISSFKTKSNDETSTIGKAKSLVMQQYNQVVPIKEFLHKPAPPANFSEATKRVFHNTSKFKANYVILSVALGAYALLSNPMLLISLLLIYAGILFADSREEKGDLVLFGKSYSPRDLKYGTIIAAVPLLYLAGATSALFWLIGASLFAVLAHASLTPIPNVDNIQDKA